MVLKNYHQCFFWDRRLKTFYVRRTVLKNVTMLFFFSHFASVFDIQAASPLSSVALLNGFDFFRNFGHFFVFEFRSGNDKKLEKKEISKKTKQSTWRERIKQQNVNWELFFFSFFVRLEFLQKFFLFSKFWTTYSLFAAVIFFLQFFLICFFFTGRTD